MIQPTALPANPGLLPFGEALPTKAAEGLEAADFGAFLAIETDGLTPPMPAPQLPEQGFSALPSPLPEAASLPESGNPLPVALPVVAPEKMAAPEPRSLPAPINLAEARQRIPAHPVAREQPARSTRPAQSLPVAEPAAKPASENGEGPVQPGALLTAPVAMPILSPEPAQRGALEATGSASPRPIVAAAIFVPQMPIALLAEVDAGGLPVPSAPQPASAPITFSAFADAMTLAPRTIETKLRLTLPAARAAGKIEVKTTQIDEPKVYLSLTEIGSELVPEATKPLPAKPGTALPAAITAERPQTSAKVAPAAPDHLIMSAAEPAPPATSLAAPAVQPLTILSAPPAADPSLRPHDFTQLVDRLVAAREFAAPQSFQVAVQHGEFGQVRLRFMREGDGLNIAMASADPEFARAVSAAPAPVLPVTPAETATQSGPRSDSPSQNAASNGHSAHQRGASPERREDRHGPADNPSATRQNEARGSRRSGIFA